MNSTKMNISGRIEQSKVGRWLQRAWAPIDSRLPGVILYGYAFLYMYTGYDKSRTVKSFIKGNKKIPYVGQYAELIGWGIPTLEVLLAILLVLPFLKAKRIALWASVALMGVFTVYLCLMMIFVPDRLCHCGGVIESMGWTSHLIFNLVWLGAGIYAISKLKLK